MSCVAQRPGNFQVSQERKFSVMEILNNSAETRKTPSSLESINWEKAGFGQLHTDHMFVCLYSDGGWGRAEIIPFGPLSLSPMALALHYGQTIFEGMKAFRMVNGSINLFRPEDHFSRMMHSASRMCIPVMPRKIFMEGLTALLSADGKGIPERPGSIYIRPRSSPRRVAWAGF
jgi:branched-chain amino acid aminotransferase